MARADGMLVGPSDGALLIESETDVPIAVTGVKVDAADGFEVVGDPSSPDQVAFSFAAEGDAPLDAADLADGTFHDVDWVISERGSLGLAGLTGRIGVWNASGDALRTAATVTWRVALA